MFDIDGSSDMKEPDSENEAQSQDYDEAVSSISAEGPNHTGNVLGKIGSYFLVASLFKSIGKYNVILSLTPFTQRVQGLTSVRSTQVTSLYLSIQESLPIVGSWLADEHYGCYKLVNRSEVVWTVGCAMMTLAVFIRMDWLFYAALFLLFGLGAGLEKSAFNVLAADQFRENDKRQVRQKESFFAYNYWIVSLGTLLVSIFLLDFTAKGWGVVPEEQSHAWGFLISAVALALCTATVMLPSRKLYKKLPRKTLTSDLFGTCWRSARKSGWGRIWLCGCVLLFLGFFSGIPCQFISQPALTYVSVSMLLTGVFLHLVGGNNTHWLSSSPAGRGASDLVALSPFIATEIIFWLMYGQTTGNMLNQGCQMNNVLANYPITSQSVSTFNLFTIVVLVPLFDNFFFPMIEKSGHRCSPLRRIGIGMGLAILAMVYSGVVEIIRKKTPVIDMENLCRGEGHYVNSLHILWTAPAFVLIGVAEVFTAITYYDLVYSEVNPHIRSIALGINMLSLSLGYMLEGIFNEVFKFLLPNDLNKGHQVVKTTENVTTLSNVA